VQRRRARTETYCIFRSNPSGEGFFKLCNFRACSQPIGAQRVHDSLDVALIDGLASIRQQSFSDRRTAMNRQYFFGRYSHIHGTSSPDTLTLGDPDLF
jgi:hypothetical protein